MFVGIHCMLKEVWGECPLPLVNKDGERALEGLSGMDAQLQLMSEW